MLSHGGAATWVASKDFITLDAGNHVIRCESDDTFWQGTRYTVTLRERSNIHCTDGAISITSAYLLDA